MGGRVPMWEGVRGKKVRSRGTSSWWALEVTPRTLMYALGDGGVLDRDVT